MSLSTKELVSYLNNLLEIERFKDYGPNGLQIPGKETVGKIATTVSANLATIEAANAIGADILIAHHGLLWDFQPRYLTKNMAGRLKAALASDLNVAMYHLPLDAHPEFGNNALITKSLGCEEIKQFGSHRGNAIGIYGSFPDGGIPASELFKRVTTLTEREPLIFDFGPKNIQTVGVISGAAASNIGDAISLELDAFITGEPAEHVMAEASEAGINFIAAGHYATETFGIKRIGEIVSEHFQIESNFIDIPNPI